MMIVTILAVSMDAYVAGISLGTYGRIKELGLLYISSFSFILPVAAMLLTSLFSFGGDWLNALSAGILIILGVRGVLPEKRESGLLHAECVRPGIAYMTLLGLSLSVDTALGAAVLYSEPCFAAVPFILFAAHYGLMKLGRTTARLLRFAGGISRAASAALIFIGIIRFL